MNTKELIIKLTLDENTSIMRNARARPADKLTWKPLDAGRSALDQIREFAQSPLWVAMILSARKWPDMDPGEWEKRMSEAEAWTTVDKCEEICNANTLQCVEAIKAFPEGEMDKTITLPFAGGIVMSFAEIMLIQYWNCLYHNGQISYIQTLYGDKEMH